jgi:hypothetical protein
MSYLWTTTHFCDHCGAVVEITLSNRNAVTTAWCKGQQQVTTYTNGIEDPVKGNHEPVKMRQIGGRSGT